MSGLEVGVGGRFKLFDHWGTLIPQKEVTHLPFGTNANSHWTLAKVNGALQNDLAFLMFIRICDASVPLMKHHEKNMLIDWFPSFFESLLTSHLVTTPQRTFMATPCFWAQETYIILEVRVSQLTGGKNENSNMEICQVVWYPNLKKIRGWMIRG